MTIEIFRTCAFDWTRKYTVLHERIPLIITDPPYGRIVNQEWDSTWSLAKQWLMTDCLDKLLMPGGVAFVWGGIGKPLDRLFFHWLAHIEERTVFTVWDVITWSKKRAYGKDNRMLFTREECAMLVKGDKPRVFNVPLLEEKRGYEGYNKKYPAKSEYKRRTNVWTDITEVLKDKIHECEKPAKLAEIMIEMCSKPGDLIVDLFAGSGSTGVAANNCGRNCILIEKSDCKMRVESNSGIRGQNVIQANS